MTDDQVEAEARRLYEIVRVKHHALILWADLAESIKDVWRDEARVQLAKEAPGE